MTDRELMQQALEALDQVADYFNVDSTEAKTIIALRKRLVQPDPSAYWHNEFLKHNTTSEQPAQQQEPSAVIRSVVHSGDGGVRITWLRGFPQIGDCLYTSPPPRKPWVGLTDEEIVGCAEGLIVGGLEFARAIEAKLKEKNT